MEESIELGAYLPLSFKRHIAVGHRRGFAHYSYTIAGLHGQRRTVKCDAISQVLVPVQENP
jgi:hypothetical protein